MLLRNVIKVLIVFLLIVFLALLTGCINCTDVYGQTIMHEIARDWHTDIAMYLKCKGVPIDQADGFGRTPLFVSVACNHLYMIEWLLDNGGMCSTFEGY